MAMFGASSRKVHDSICGSAQILLIMQIGFLTCSYQFMSLGAWFVDFVHWVSMGIQGYPYGNQWSVNGYQ